jgi:spore germination protein KC
MEREIEKTVFAVQEKYGSDIFGFGEEIHRANPKVWKKLKGNWNKEFANVEFKANAHIRIRRTGMILDSVEEKTKQVLK